MRYKVAPDPGWDRLADAHRAVPLVPGSTDDCCARLQSRLDLPSREDARKWLTFLSGLELVRNTDRGYERIRTDLDADTLGPAFRERIFGAREVLTTLEDAEEPLSAGNVFEQIQEIVPTWERHRHGDWKQEWHERIERLLGWAVLFELASEEPTGYIESPD